jgi:hypothetical protein
MNHEQYRALVKANSINRGDLRTNPEFRNPTPADIGKPMYWPSGRWAGTFNGLENDRFGEPRAKFAINEEPVVGFTDNPDDIYVEINPPPRRGGKSRRRQTKKTRRGKSKRRGRKTRGRRR